MEEAPEHQSRLARMKFRERLKEYFLTGILVFVPIMVSVWVLKISLEFVDGFFAGLPEKYHPHTYLPIPGVGVLVILLTILFVGAFARNYLGRVTYYYGDQLMSNIPVLKGIYKGVKQMLETVVASPSQNFRKVVLIEYPRKDVWTIAFLTGNARGEIERVAGRPLVNVFVPTTPNPTSGYMLILPEEDVIHLNMKVEDAFKIIISGGMVQPGEGSEPQNRHLPRPLPRRFRADEKKAV